jgi:hypothetical protein
MPARRQSSVWSSLADVGHGTIFNWAFVLTAITAVVMGILELNIGTSLLVKLEQALYK